METYVAPRAYSEPRDDPETQKERIAEFEHEIKIHQKYKDRYDHLWKKFFKLKKNI